VYFAHVLHVTTEDIMLEITSRELSTNYVMEAQVASWEELFKHEVSPSPHSDIDLCGQVHQSVMQELRRAALKNELAHPERAGSLYHTVEGHLDPMARHIGALYRQGHLHRDEWQLLQIMAGLHDLNVPLKPGWTDLEEVREHFLKVDENSPFPEERLRSILNRLVKENTSLSDPEHEAEVMRRFNNPRPEEVTVAAAEVLLESLRDQFSVFGDADHMIRLTTDAIIHGTTFPLQVAQERGYGFSTEREVEENFFAGVLAVADLTSVESYEDLLNNSRRVYAECGFSPKLGQTYEDAINQFAYGFLTNAVAVRLQEITSYIEKARQERADDPHNRLDRLERIVLAAEAKVTELLNTHLSLTDIEVESAQNRELSTGDIGSTSARHSRHGAARYSEPSVAA
jgi:hypothetical protein